METGGFSEAARQLGLAVSSVTRQVNSLEAMLNTQLLNRSTRSITLTLQGQKYYDKVVQILQDIEEADLCVMEQGEIPHGTLRVSLPVTFGRLHIAPILSDFLTQYPEVKLDLQLSDGLANLVESDLDVVIRIGNLDRSNPNLIVRKLAAYNRYVCGSPTYFKQYGKPNHPNDLMNHNCLLFAYSTTHQIWRFRRETEVCEVKVSGSVVANHSEMLRQLCLDGIGSILMPTWLIGEDIQAGRLQAVLTDFQISPQTDPDTRIYALYLPSRKYSQRVRVFIDFLIEQFGNPPYWETNDFCFQF
ncbi:MAG: LysR family transcriptional regulator [Hydrococcus sp. RM1_1_31]|nr:LysR family transcriptional regulator [Hydrococcus sp. RM1_1_31]